MFIKKIKFLVFLLMITLQSGCSDDLELHRGLSEQAANAVVAELDSKGIAASKHEGKEGYTVVISFADFSDAVKVLQSAGLPSQAYSSLGEVFRKEGIISSPLEERARYIFALSQELEFTLSQIDGVVMARVHIVLPERIAPGEQIQPASAAVFIKHNRHVNTEALRLSIKKMIASGIPGMANAYNSRLAIAFIPTEEAAVKQGKPARAVMSSDIFYLFGALFFLLSLYFFLPRRGRNKKFAQSAAKMKRSDE